MNNKPIFDRPHWDNGCAWLVMNYIPRDTTKFPAMRWHMDDGVYAVRERDVPAAAAAIEAELAAIKPVKAPRPRLGGRRHFSTHCAVKAREHAVTAITEDAGRAEYNVRSGSGKTYRVALTRHTADCTCPHGLMAAKTNRSATCSHVAAVANYREGVTA